ncbi:MAG: hypothetical protein NUW08_01465 [Candidatus Uhrbacteria bacterium]|nr:hypothetical protein [Candidatus Uhrbacteria bacterium]
MSRQPKILFVAGDGASGRITAETGELLKGERPMQVHFIQRDGGAAGLYGGENREHVVIDASETHLAEPTVREADLVVIAHSGTAFQLECAVASQAFAHRIPVLKVFDHLLGTRHAYLRDVVADWVERGRPPLRVTATTDAHVAELRALYPELDDVVAKIGNPLHVQLETLLADGLPAARGRLREAHGLVTASPVVSAFLSGNNEDQFAEMLDMADALAAVLATRGGGLAVNVHFVNQDWKPRVEERMAAWRDAGVPVSEGVKPDEMIALCDLLFASPTSTTCERALANGIPVVQSCGSAEAAGLRVLSGMDFPYTPEMTYLAVLLATGKAGEWEFLLDSALDPAQQALRRRFTDECGAVPASGAIFRLRDLILEMTR